MFGKINRLKKTGDFKKIFKEGKFISGDLIDLRLVSNNLGTCRFGFLVSLKVSKKATVRNKIKRQLSESVIKNIFPEDKSFDILIQAKPKIVGKSYQEIKENVKDILSELEKK